MNYKLTQGPSVICCDCLHKHKVDPGEPAAMSLDYPFRTVEIGGVLWSCPACGNCTDGILFGEAFITTNARNMDHPAVKENNDICYKRKRRHL